jgi:hypothetical protein
LVLDLYSKRKDYLNYVWMKLVFIVTGTVTDVLQTSPFVSDVIIVYVIDNTALLQKEWYSDWIQWTFK